MLSTAPETRAGSEDDGSMNIAALVNSLRHNPKTAIVETQAVGDSVLSYHDIYEATQRRRLIFQEIGLRAGAVVLLSASSSCQFVVNLLALVSDNIVPIVVSPHAKSALIAHMGEKVRVDAAIFPTHRQLDKGLPDYSLVRELESTSLSVWSVRGNASITLPDESNILLLSSGTTGTPKFLVHDFNKLLLNAQLHLEAIAHASTDVTLLVLPCHFSYGLVAGILANLIAQTALVFLSQPFSFAEWSEVCVKYAVTTCLFTPFLIRKLLSEQRKFPSPIKKITIGGNVTSAALLCELAVLYDNDVYLTYGLTEAGPRVFTKKYDLKALEDVHVGVPLRGISAKLMDTYVDREGRLCGELYVLTPTSMRYKIDEHGINRSDLVDGWLRTHDIFMSDGAGERLVFLGREKDLIDVAGEKISAQTVQALLLENDSLSDALVYPVSDREWGSAFEAKVVLREECAGKVSAEHIHAWCNRNMRLIERPQRILIRKSIGTTVRK
jgi:long-chain acyl-CoA synthetase